MSEIVQEERDINGLTVTTRQLTPMRAYRLLSKLGKLAGPIAKALTPGAIERVKAGDYGAAIPIAMSVFIELKDEENEALALDILRGTAVKMSEGNQPKLLQIDSSAKIDIAFQGNLKAMLGAMLFALEVNYRDFFVGRVQDASTIPIPSP